MKITEMTQAIVDIKNRIDWLEIEDEMTLLDTLEALEGSWEQRLEYLAGCVIEMNNNATIIKMEVDRLQERKAKLLKRAEDLEGFIETQMFLVGKKKVEFPLYTVGFRKNPPSVQIVDETIIPNDYRIYKTTESIDKASIKEQLKAGNKIPGCELVQGEKLTIK